MSSSRESRLGRASCQLQLEAPDKESNLKVLPLEDLDWIMLNTAMSAAVLSPKVRIKLPVTPSRYRFLIRDIR